MKPGAYCPACDSFTCTHVAMHHRLLSPREVQIIRLVGQAKCPKEIAAEIRMSHGSVKTYLSRIYHKLDLTFAHGVGSPRVALALWARDHLRTVRVEMETDIMSRREEKPNGGSRLQTTS